MGSGGVGTGGTSATGGVSGSGGRSGTGGNSATGGRAEGGARGPGSGGSSASGGSATGGSKGQAGQSGGGAGGRATGGGGSGGSLSRYVFTAFTNGSESNMYVYTSTDGLNFKLTKGPAYTPPMDLVRDPSVIKHSDGLYYIAYTVNWDGAQFGIARSQDLQTWTFVANIPVGVSGVTSTWAPEWFREPDDGSLNIIVSLSKGNRTNFTPYRFHATDDTLTHFGEGTQLAGLSPNYIDTFIVKVGSTYHNFSKNETTKYIEHGTSTSLTGPFTITGKADWAGWGANLEGPALFRTANGGWRILMDGYSDGHYYYSDSSDLMTWSAKKELPGGLSGNVRHGTVLPE